MTCRQHFWSIVDHTDRVSIEYARSGYRSPRSVFIHGLELVKSDLPKPKLTQQFSFKNIITKLNLIYSTNAIISNAIKSEQLNWVSPCAFFLIFLKSFLTIELQCKKYESLIETFCFSANYSIFRLLPVCMSWSFHRKEVEVAKGAREWSSSAIHQSILMTTWSQSFRRRSKENIIIGFSFAEGKGRIAAVPSCCTYGLLWKKIISHL